MDSRDMGSNRTTRQITDNRLHNVSYMGNEPVTKKKPAQAGFVSTREKIPSQIGHRNTVAAVALCDNYVGDALHL